MKQSLGWKFLTLLSIILLYLSSVMNMYAVFGDEYLDIYTGYFTILLWIVLGILNTRTGLRELYMPKKLKWYLAYSLVVVVLTNITSGLSETLTASLTVIIGMLLLGMFWDTYRNEKFMKVYVWIAVVTIGFFFFQYFVKLTTGIGISGVIPFLHLSHGVSQDVIFNQMYVYKRSSSFFSEPSHFAQFLIPLLIYLLFDKTSSAKFKNPLIVSIFATLLMTMSGTAIALLIPTFFFIAVGTWKKYQHNRVIAIFLICVVSVGLLYFGNRYLSSDMGSFVNERSAEVFTADRNDAGSSGFIRIWRGYFVFADFSPIEMLFGTGNHKAILGHVFGSHMELFLEDFGLTYFNTIQYILIHTGFVGFFLFILYLAYLWKDNNVCGRCLIVTFVLLMFIESIYGGSRMALFLMMAQYQKIKDRSSQQHILSAI